MKFLLFILGMSFFFIFYFFYGVENMQNSFFKNTFIEANIYILAALICIFYIWKQEIGYTKVQGKDDEDSTFPVFLFNISYSQILKIFFEKYIYILGIFLFYLSLFLFLHVFFVDINLSWIFLFFNVLVLTLYFVEERFQVFQDLLRVNTSFISLYYIFFHIAYLFGIVEGFGNVDILNIGLVWVLFYVFLNSTRRKKYIPEFYSYILIFFFLELLVFLKFILGSTYIGALGISSIFAGMFLIYTSELSKIINIQKKYIRIWGLCSGYIYILLVSKYIIYPGILSVFFLPIAVGVSGLLFLFHRRFENYISLFFAVCGSCISFHIIYWLFLGGDMYYKYMGIYMIFISFLYILSDTYFSRKYVFDSYFFHIFSLLVNILGCILFVLYYDIFILSLSILLMVESIYFFYSYYTLPKNTL